MAELGRQQIESALASEEPHYLVRILATQGSTPRNAGAVMLVGAQNVCGTIGGGSAEWSAIETAREILNGAKTRERETITLGPEIDQCCGGTIDVSYVLLSDETAARLELNTEQKRRQNILIFGAGHTGLALAKALSVLDFDVSIIDSRAEYCDKVGEIDFNSLALPEAAVRAAPDGTVFVITTHDHSQDFLITAEVLTRRDAAYVGMIGSGTKRAVLKSWMTDNGYSTENFDNLHCPLGGTRVRNKQPEVIAAMCVAEILTALESV